MAGEDILTISSDLPGCPSRPAPYPTQVPSGGGHPHHQRQRGLPPMHDDAADAGEPAAHQQAGVCVCREEGRETGEGRRLVHNGADRNGTMPSPTSPAWPPAGRTLQPASFQPTSSHPLPLQAIGDILKTPHLLRQAVSAVSAVDDRQLPPSEQLLRRLCADISRCVQADTCYSPLSDLAKQAAGGLTHACIGGIAAYGGKGRMGDGRGSGP